MIVRVIIIRMATMRNGDDKFDKYCNTDSVARVVTLMMIMVVMIVVICDCDTGDILSFQSSRRLATGLLRS